MISRLKVQPVDQMCAAVAGGEEEVRLQLSLVISAHRAALNQFFPLLLHSVLQVRGVCQYGKLNYYLGAKGATERKQSMYPDIDFCKNPGAICSDRRAPELRWVTGKMPT